MPAFHAFEPAARIIVATLFNSLWEDAILALIVWAILRFATNVNATTRYALWISALVAAIVLPLVTTAPLVTTVTQRAATQPHLRSVAAPAAKPIVSGNLHRTSTAVKPAPKSNAPVAHAPAATAATAAKAFTPAIRLPERFRFSVPAMVAVALFGVWALVAFALMLRVIVGLVRLERLKSDSLPLPLEYREHLARWAQAHKGGRDVRLCVSDKIEVPVAVGLFDAMILIPQHLLDSLSQEEIDQITLHELAHLRRGDDWTNGLQRVIQSLFFFNPAILWMAQQLDLEREVACDDWVLLQTNEVRPYAFCLTKMAEVTAWPHRALAAPGVFVTRKSLSIRVERLLRAGRDIRTSVTFAPATIVGAMVIVLFFVLQTVAPSFAFAEEDTTIVTAEPSTTQPGKQDVTVVHRTNHSTEIQQFNDVEKGKIPQRILIPKTNSAQVYEIVTDRKELARLHQQLRAMPSMPVIPAIPKMTKVHTAIPPMPKIATMPDVHVHVAIPPVPAIPYTPDSQQIRAQIKNAMKAVDVATIANTAATTATQRALKAVQVTRLHSHLHEVGSLNGANCVGCDLSGVNWSGRDLHGAKMSGVDFSAADLHNVNFSGASLVGVDFSKANLRGANFSGAKLSGCDLSGADLTGANLNVASFVGCDVDARHLAPEQARLLLSKCTGCDFHGVDLHNQDLRGVHISGDDMTDADLRGANLDGAEFVGVDLSGAKLDGAHLNGTKFSGCDFDGADLSRVDLSRAVITGSKFKP
jgi:uncharacterized protein YjbI with pentapeptide repeats/beta-lactamase regulating signal transducer with metallopeptidase domain